MGAHRTCGEPDEIKKNTHPENMLPLFFGTRYTVREKIPVRWILYV